MSELLDKLPDDIRLAVLAGAMLAGAIIWILGRRSQAGEHVEQLEQVERERRIEELQAQLLEERFSRVEADLRLVLAAMRDGLTTEVHRITGDLAARLSELSSRIDRLASRIRPHHPES